MAGIGITFFAWREWPNSAELVRSFKLRGDELQERISAVKQGERGSRPKGLQQFGGSVILADFGEWRKWGFSSQQELSASELGFRRGRSCRILLVILLIDRFRNYAKICFGDHEDLWLPLYLVDCAVVCICH